LDHASRSAPNVAIAHNQAVSEEHLHSFKARPFVVLAVSTSQNPAYFTGVIHEIGEPSIWLGHAHHIPVFALQLLQRRQCLGINTESDAITGARWFSEFSLDGRHEEMESAVSH
jgi:hypothetical protein